MKSYIYDDYNQEKSFRKFWNWLWKSESIWSYIVFLLIVFIIVKFIFLPGIGLIFRTQLPLAIVESSSMEHYSLKECTQVNSNLQCISYSSYYSICGNHFEKSKFFNASDYWNTCGSWYEQNTNITKSDFSELKFKNGFRKGDIMIVFGKKASEIRVGDVIIFNAGRATPIIHRVVSLTPLQTKGDHNPGQLTSSNNYFDTDETNINENQIVGVAVARIPYLGWVKLFFVELFRKIF